MKRTLSSLILLVTLSACGSSSGTATVTCDQQFWNNVFAACLPEGWKVLSQDSLATLGMPEETVAAFQFETPHAGQLDTVTATREPLVSDVTTSEYSEANILAVSALPDYTRIDNITVTIDGEESALHVFTARPSADKPARRYYQVSAVKEKVGYTFTGSFPLSVADSESDQVQFILKNLSFTDPTAKK